VTELAVLRQRLKVGKWSEVNSGKKPKEPNLDTVNQHRKPVQASIKTRQNILFDGSNISRNIIELRLGILGQRD
jgi:hypothetical protein